MLAKLPNRFLLLAVGSLTLFASFSIKAQNASAKCEKGYTYDYVYDQVYEPESETVYNPATDRYDARTVWRWKWRWVWKCVPTPPKTHSTTSKTKRPDSSESNVTRNTDIKPSPGLRRPFAGQYSGKWFTTFSEVRAQKGEWTLSVDAAGKITGKEVNTTFDATADISGLVNEDGHIELRLKYGGIFNEAQAALIKGRITNVEDRHLRGTLRQYDGEKVTSVIEIDLAPIRSLLPN